MERTRGRVVVVVVRTLGGVLVGRGAVRGAIMRVTLVERGLVKRAPVRRAVVRRVLVSRALARGAPAVKKD